MRGLKILSAFLIIFTVLCLSIGYSAFQSSSIVSDIKGLVRAKADIRITNITASSTNSGYTTYDEYDVRAIESSIILPNTSDTVTYTVEITNIGNQDMALTEITGLPSNMEIKNMNYTYGTKLCDANRCHNGSVNTINLTIGYKNTVTSGSSNAELLHLDFTFKKVYSINYVNFTDTTGLPIEIVESSTLNIDFSSLSSVPSSVSVTGASLDNSNFPVIALSNADNNVIITPTYSSNEPDGSENNPYENTSATYTSTGLQEGYTIFTNTPGNPKVYVDENNKVTEFRFTDENANVALNNSPIDTGILAFDGDNFNIHLVFTTAFNANTRKTFLSALTNESNSNSKYTGFVFTVYQAYRVRIYSLNNSTIGGNGYGGSSVYDFQFPTSTGNTVSKYVLDMTYTASTKTLSTTMKYGPNDGTSIENFTPLSNSESVSTFPATLSNATITVGGNGVNNTYNMNSMNVLEFVVTRG